MIEKDQYFLPKIRIRIDVEQVPDETKHYHIEHAISLLMLQNLPSLTMQDEVLDHVFHKMIRDLQRTVGWGMR